MFGSNKLIKTTILNASENYLNEYAQDIIELYNEYGEDLNEEQFYKVRNEYLDNVANNAFDVFRVSSPMIYQRILLAIQTPLICGYDFEDGSEISGMMAGKVYAIIFWAYHNKIAKPKDCVEINHKQNDIMQKALVKVDRLVTESKTRV